MRIDDLSLRLRALGARPSHEARVLRRWIQGLPQSGGRPPDEHFLPTRLRQALPLLEAEWDALAHALSSHPGADDSIRLLVQTRAHAHASAATVESVLLPRGGLCVSTQVGCAVGCVFCMTGRDGLLGQLGSAQIVAQVALGRRLRPVRKVVFMGMGEPAHNLDAVMEAIEFLGTFGGIAHKNLVFSTVGDRRVFERLPAGRVKPALALSLHTTRADLRAQLLPRAPRVDPAELVELAEHYARCTGYPIQYQWTLLDGINDGADEIDAAARLLAGRHAILNLIPYNANDGLAYRRPDSARCAAIAQAFTQRGILAKLRQSAGQDVEGGCGQLRSRALDGSAAAPVHWRAEARVTTVPPSIAPP